MERRIHLFPYRTQKLSFSSPKILDWRRSGKIGRCRCTCKEPKGSFFCTLCNGPMRTICSRRHPPAFPGPELTQLRFAKIFLRRAKFWPLALKDLADAPIKSRKALFLLLLKSGTMLRLLSAKRNSHLRVVNSCFALLPSLALFAFEKQLVILITILCIMLASACLSGLEVAVTEFLKYLTYFRYFGKIIVY